MDVFEITYSVFLSSGEEEEDLVTKVRAPSIECAVRMVEDRARGIYVRTVRRLTHIGASRERALSSFEVWYQIFSTKGADPCLIGFSCEEIRASDRREAAAIFRRRHDSDEGRRYSVLAVRPAFAEV